MTCFDAKIWQASWKSELQSIMDHDTFNKPIMLPERNNAITAKVFWDIKYAEDGSIVRYKVQLITRGFTQVYGIDYEETFTPTICYENLCIFFAIIAKNNWKVYQVNIVTTFLAGKLDEIIYLRVPYFLQYLSRNYV